MSVKQGKQHRDGPAGPGAKQRVLKVTGADVELGNCVTGLQTHGSTGVIAAPMLLREIDGIAANPTGSWSSDDRLVSAFDGLLTQGPPSGDKGDRPTGVAGSPVNPQDRLRRFLPANGGCAYIDLNHLELCTPEVTSASDHVAAWHAMLRIARQAQIQANEKLPAGVEVRVLVNNSDGMGNSYGSHLNLLTTRQAMRNLFQRKLQYLLYLATYQVSSIIFTGQGKVGAENGARDVEYQISQRADFFETLTGSQTTYHRPLVNSRDEALCGDLDRVADGESYPAGGLARLHCIFYDNSLAHTSGYLKVGGMQIILAMIEAEDLDLGLALEDPVAAVHDYSGDPNLKATAPLLSREKVTALELQRRFLRDAQRFAATGGLEGVVPEWRDILRRWENILAVLAGGDLEEQARYLDWPLKKLIIERTIARHPGLNWRSPAVKHLDQVYGSLDPADGLYLAFERSGFTTPIAGDDRIAHLVSNPPDDTRAWTRAMTLRRTHRNDVDMVDWDGIRFRHPDWRRMRDFRFLAMDDPRGQTRDQTQAMFRGTEGLDELLIALRAEDQTIHPRGNGWDGSGLCFPLTVLPDQIHHVNENHSSRDEDNQGE